MISVMIWTYNRPHLVERAINSVLNQSYRDFEIVLVNNGSTDNTADVIDKYVDNERVRIFHLEKNRGYLGGWKFALGQIKGIWFTDLSDDDTIEPNALETLINVPKEIGGEIDAVTCNSFDSATGEFSGFGLDHDQWLPIDVILQKTYGEFFGITKTELIADIEINEYITSYDEVFFYLIDAKAKRYYIHKALKTWHTDHGPTMTKSKLLADSRSKSESYKGLVEEKEYWTLLKKYNQKRYVARCLRGLFFVKMSGMSEAIKKYKRLLDEVPLDIKSKMAFKFFLTIHPKVLQLGYEGARKSPAIWYSTRVFFKRYGKI